HAGGHDPQRGLDALLVRARLDLPGEAAVGVDVGDLPDADNVAAEGLEHVEHGGAGRRQREVTPGAAEPHELTRLAGERSGDDTSHRALPDEDRSRGLTPGVEGLERDDVDVRRDLEDAVRAG